MIARTRRRDRLGRSSRTLADGRLITLTDEAWEVQRKAVHDRADGRCEGLVSNTCLADGSHGVRPCNRLAPLHEVKDPVSGQVVKAGHAHHTRGRKVRDDREDALEWLCWECHDRRHVPAKVVPSKRAGQAMEQVRQQGGSDGTGSDAVGVSGLRVPGNVSVGGRGHLRGGRGAGVLQQPGLPAGDASGSEGAEYGGVAEPG